MASYQITRGSENQRVTKLQGESEHKYTGINIQNTIQDLYTKKYKTLLKEMKRTLKSTERKTMIVDWKIQYCKNISSP